MKISRTKIKKQGNEEQDYFKSSIGFLEGYGKLGAKPKPFDYQQAINRFRSWVFAAARLNAYSVASVPLRLYVRKRSKQKCLYQSKSVSISHKRFLLGDLDDKPSNFVLYKTIDFGTDFEEVTESHPLLDLLRKANSFWNGFDLTALRILYGELTGNAYQYINQGPLGIPDALWPMPSQWVEVLPDKENFIKGYVYGKSAETKRVFALEEIIHFKRPNPNNQFYGMGNVEAGWGVINQNESEHVMSQALYDNHARPDFAVIFKGGYSDAALQRFQDRVNNLLKGAKKSGGFLPISSEAQIIPLNFPPKDLSGRSDMIEEIAGIFGVPATKLKGSWTPKSNAESGDAQWMKDTILPLCRMDEEKLNESLLPLFGIEDDAVLAYDNPVPQDKIFERDRNVVYANTGVMTLNEIRMQEGFEPLDGGDVLRVNGVPLDKIGLTSFPTQFPIKSGTAQTSGASPSRSGFTFHPKDCSCSAGNILQSDLLRGKIKSNCKCTYKKSAEDTLREDESEKQIMKLMKEVGQVLDKQMNDLFDLLSREFKSIRMKQLSEDQIKDVFNKYRNELVETFKTNLETIIITGGESALQKLNLDPGVFNVSNPRVAEFISNHTLKLAGEVNQTTLDSIKNLLKESTIETTSFKELKDAIMESGNFSGFRAEMIARTESATAYVEGTRQGWKESDVVEAQEWDSQFDACDWCVEMNGRIVGLDSKYFQRGETFVASTGAIMNLNFRDISGPPLHPNCRCTLLPVLKKIEDL